jgi:ABC-type sulfate transport system substrate-binding protein
MNGFACLLVVGQCTVATQARRLRDLRLDYLFASDGQKFSIQRHYRPIQDTLGLAS